MMPALAIIGLGLVIGALATVVWMLVVHAFTRPMPRRSAGLLEQFYREHPPARFH